MKSRSYKILQDFQNVCDFLSSEYKNKGSRGLTQPQFEYSQTHCAFEYQLAHRCRLWEDKGRIVGLACYEFGLGDAFLLASDGYEDLYEEMLSYAELHLSSLDEGRRSITIPWKSEDEEMSELFKKHGFRAAWKEPDTIYDYKKGFDHDPLPEGYTLVTLEEECDYYQMNRCLYLGFDHGPELEFEESDLDERATMHTAPGFRKDLGFVVKAPDGTYACYLTIWLDSKNQWAYLEPLATVPEHRNKGLAKIALMEAMKKSAELGAKYCVGGSVKFYEKVGFEEVGQTTYWTK